MGLDKVLAFLTASGCASVTTGLLGQNLNRPWREISKMVMTDTFKATLSALGWSYVRGKGRASSRFEKSAVERPQAA